MCSVSASRRQPESFMQACRKFVYTENLLGGTANTQDAAARSRSCSNPLIAATPMIKKVIARWKAKTGGLRSGRSEKGLPNLAPDFDSRTYGSRKLSDLVRKTNAFEIEQPKWRNHANSDQAAGRITSEGASRSKACGVRAKSV